MLCYHRRRGSGHDCDIAGGAKSTQPPSRKHRGDSRATETIEDRQTLSHHLGEYERIFSLGDQTKSQGLLWYVDITSVLTLHHRSTSNSRGACSLNAASSRRTQVTIFLPEDKHSMRVLVMLVDPEGRLTGPAPWRTAALGNSPTHHIYSQRWRACGSRRQALFRCDECICPLALAWTPELPVTQYGTQQHTGTCGLVSSHSGLMGSNPVICFA